MKKVILHLVMLVTIVGLYGVWASRLFSEEKILARVGERVITQDDLKVLMKIYETSRKENLSLDDKKNLLNLLIKSVLISIEAEREKLDQKPEIKAELQMLRNDRLMREYIMTRIDPLVTVKNEEVEETLKKNPNLMIPKETVTLKEILVKMEKEAEEIYQELKNGADFSKIATEKSIAQSKTNGGLIGTISAGQLPPDLGALVSNLKEGEFSKPMKSDEGFRIFYLVTRKERDPEQIKMLEGKIRDKVIELERNKKIEVMIEKKVEELKKEIKVETYPDQIK